MSQPIEELIRGLAISLTSVAQEFQERAERLSTEPNTPVPGSDTPAGGTGIALLDVANRILAQRKMRKKYFSADLFHEPGWDMLIAIYIAHRENRTMYVKSLVGMADAPVTTSQRWIDHLHRLGLVNRVVDPDDRRRIEVSLSADGESAMARYLEAIATP